MEQLINNLRFTIYNFQFTVRGVARVGEHQSRGPLVGGFGADERQDPEGGQLIVELLIAFGLASILIPAVILGFISGSNGKVQQQQRLVAAGYLREAEEAVRNARDQDWMNVATNGTYHPVAGANSWSLVAGSESIGTYFTRSIVISDLNPVDPSQKYITVNVSWSSIFPTTLTSTFVLSRWKNISSDLTVSGRLLNQGSGDWCAPSLSLGSIDLGNATAQTISAIQGQVTTGTGQAAAGFTFVNALLTDPAAPATPSASAINTFDGPTKTNDVFALSNYAFIATDSHTKDVDIINLKSVSGGKYLEGGFFDSPSNGSANAGTVVASPSAAFMTIGDMLYDFSLAGLPNTSTSRTAIHPAGLKLPAPATKMVILGSRLYISTTSSTYQMVVVDANTLTFIPKPAASPGKIHVNGLGGKSVFVNSTGTRAYVATVTSATLKEVFIVNVDETSTDFGNTVGSYDTNGMDPTGIVLVNLPKLIVVGHGGEQYQVVDVTDDTKPTRCDHGLTTGDLNGVATVFTNAQRAYSYIITNTNSNQLRIIEGGPGGGGSGGGLTIESASLDASHSSTFNSISITNVTPPTVTVTYQVAVSTDCSTFNYIGNFTTAGGFIPININPGRCFRYKAIFSNGGGATDVSTTVRVNYSP